MPNENTNGRERLLADSIGIYGSFLMAALKPSIPKPIKSKVKIEDDKEHFGRFGTCTIYEPWIFGIMGREIARIQVSERTYLGGFNRVDVFDGSLAHIVETSVSELNKEYGLSLTVNKRYNT